MKLRAMGWRNVWRNRRRSIVTVAAMSLAFLMMVLYHGLFRGRMDDMEHQILDVGMGEIQLHAPGYRNNPSLYARVEDSQDTLAALRKAGFRASARLLASGLAAAGDASAGVSLRGVDPKAEATVSVIGDEVHEGKWLDPTDPMGVVIGKRVAKTLGVGLGDELVVLTQGADGSMANDLYEVRGVLSSVGDAIDRTGVFMNEAAFRDLLVIPEGVHEILVRTPNGNGDLDAAAERVAALAPGVEVKTWRQLSPTLASMYDQAKGTITVMMIIVYLVIGIVILNAMLMAVFERVREFGVLKALGFGPGMVMRLIYVETAIQVVLALLVGGLLAIPCGWYLATTGVDLSGAGDLTFADIAVDPVMRGIYDASTVVLPAVLLVVISAISALYPALKAALIRPVAAIGHR